MTGRSEGARLLARACEAHGQQAIAARLGCSRQFVCSLVAGQKRPSPERRERARAELGIDPSAWDLPPSSPSSPSTSVTTVATPAPSGETTARARDLEAPAAPLARSKPDASGGQLGALAAAEAHLAACTAALDRLGPGASPRELAALLGARAGAVRALAAAEPVWSRLLKSAEWRAIEGAIREALSGLEDDRLERLARFLEARHVEASRAGSQGGGS